MPSLDHDKPTGHGRFATAVVNKVRECGPVLAGFRSWVVSRMAWVTDHPERVIPALVATCLIGTVAAAVLVWGITEVITGLIAVAAILAIGGAAAHGTGALLDWLRRHRDRRALPPPAAAEADEDNRPDEHN